MVSRWGNDSAEFREYSSKMLTTFAFDERYTYYYYGDEIGMTNAKFDNVEDYRDIETLAEYERLQNTGGDLIQFIKDQKTAREITEERQWDDSENGGFSTAEPLKVNDNHVYLNAAAQEKTQIQC
jgi:oligo-1,6-glucosidase